MKSKSQIRMFLIVTIFVSMIISVSQAKAADWETMDSGVSTPLRSVWGNASNDIFAVGDGGVILHYDGTLWSSMNSGTDEELRRVWGSATNDVFAVGRNGVIRHYDGSTWTSMNSTTSDYLTGVWGSASDNVFAVSQTGQILHYDGGNWSEMDFISNYWWDIWGRSANEVYIVNQNGDILRYDGNTWIDMKNSSSDHLTGIWGSGPDDIFSVGGSLSSVILHYDGTTWTKITHPLSDSTYQLQDIWGSGSDNVFIVGNHGSILHYGGNVWTKIESGTTANLRGVWGNSSDNLFVVGDSGTILHYPATPQEQPILSLTPGFREVSSTSGTTTFNVANSGTGTMTWTATANEDWLSVTNGDSGTNSGVITVSYAENPNEMPRIGTITVTSPDVNNSPQTVEVRQSALEIVPVLSVTPAFREVSATDGAVTFEIKNIGTGTMTWTATTNAEWLSITSDGGTNKGIITVSYEANSGDARTGIITITAPDAEDSPQSVEVRQKSGWQPILSVNPASQDIPATSGSMTFEIKNVGTGTMTWTAAANVGWISITPNTGTDNGTVTVNYEANPGLARTGIITITAPDTANSPEAVEIKQSCGFELSVTPLLLNLSANEGTITFEIANTGSGEMAWTISENTGWFSIDRISGTNTETITVVYEQNSEGEVRSGVITVTAPGAENSPQIIEVSQNTPDWMLMESDISNHLRGIWGSSKENIFAVGSSGTILQYDGNFWRIMESPTTAYLRGVWGSSANNIFAVGHGGIILHYNGSVWEQIESGVTANLRGIWGSSATNIFAVGESGTIIRYDGNSWQKMTTPTFDSLFAISGSSGKNIFAVGGLWDAFTILHYDGNANGVWTKMQTDGISDIPYGIWGNSANNFFVVGTSGMMLRYDGFNWNQMSSGTSDYLHGVWGTAVNNLFTVGVAGKIFHFDGSTCKEMVTETSKDLFAIWGSSENDIFAVGNSGTILHYPYQRIVPGDLDGNGETDLRDVILGLKILAGINVSSLYIKADVNEDGKIGMDDVVFILQKEVLMK